MLPLDPKPWWHSRGIWAAILTAAAGLLRLFGVALDVSSATDLALELAQLAEGLALLAFGFLAWVGRVRASAPISREVAPGVTLPGVGPLGAPRDRGPG